MMTKKKGILTQKYIFASVEPNKNECIVDQNFDVALR